MEIEVSSRRGNTVSRGPALRQVASGIPALGVVQTLVKRLQEGNTTRAIDTDSTPKGLPDTLADACHVTNDERSREQDDKQGKHEEVEDRVANNTSLAKLRLLQGVNRGTNLATVTGLVTDISDVRW